MFTFNVQVHHHHTGDGEVLKEVKALALNLNLFKGNIMSALEDLKREVAETQAAASAAAENIGQLKAQVAELLEKVRAGEAIEAELAELAVALDNAQKQLAGTAGEETPPGGGTETPPEGGDTGTGEAGGTSGEGDGTNPEGNPQA